jgi:hypothetical protein
MLRRLTQTLSLLALTSLLLSACGGAAPAPTATPTKTPMAAAAAPTKAPTDTPTPVALDTPTPIPPTATATPSNLARFTGLPVDDPAKLTRPPVFICVNNDPVGRSAHWGLSQADLVYEYIVDGFSLTRITAMFQANDADRVGPVRSARFPNIWMVQMYGGALACSGGSDHIRYLLKNEVGFPYLDADIDDPSNTVYFQNLGSDYRTRLQIGTEAVRRWLADQGIALKWDKPGFSFSDAPPAGDAGPGTVIDITYPGGNDVEWRYDPGLGGYIRFQGGEQQFDPATNQPIVAKNVLVVAAEHVLTDIVEDSLGTKGVDIKLNAFGDLRVFRDGKVYEGTWRGSQDVPPKWLGAGEVPINLKPGQSWVQVVQKIPDITYQ